MTGLVALLPVLSVAMIIPRPANIYFRLYYVLALSYLLYVCI